MAATHFSGPVVSANGFTASAGGAAVTGGVTADTLAVGSSGSTIKKIFSSTFSLDPGAIGASQSSEQAVTITGIAPGDAMILEVPASLNTGLAWSGYRISTTDTLQVVLVNVTAGSINDTARTWRYTWIDMT